MFDLLKRFQKKAQTDISALLLTAFVFQLITPILAFADQPGKLGNFETADWMLVHQRQTEPGGLLWTIRYWRFLPAKHNGKNVISDVIVPIHFRLNS